MLGNSDEQSIQVYEPGQTGYPRQKKEQVKYVKEFLVNRMLQLEYQIYIRQMMWLIRLAK